MNRAINIEQFQRFQHTQGKLLVLLRIHSVEHGVKDVMDRALTIHERHQLRHQTAAWQSLWIASRHQDVSPDECIISEHGFALCLYALGALRHTLEQSLM